MAEALSLMQRVRAVAARAHGTGALAPIRTRVERVMDGGIEFVVRVVDSLARKDEARRRPGETPANPFLPCEPALFVADLSPTHYALLNKFPAIEPHLLIATRAFAEQESALTAADFDALALALREYDGLAFYNAGRVAGASQRHKHLQLVPRALADGDAQAPVEAALPPAPAGGIVRCAALPWRHALLYLEAGECADGARMTRRCEALLDAIGQSGARRYSDYNLLLTRRWMMAVPRRHETCAGIAVNALGFAGALLARNDEELARIRQSGPLRALERAAG